MRDILSGMDDHLSQEVTTLCTCWKIVRTDGEVYGFTDHDVDLAFDGVPYESETGYNRTAISGDSSMTVDNLDVTGFLDSERISENDLRNGLFDYASVYIFAVNWQNPDGDGAVKLRRGWFGEVTITQNGVFQTEVRGLHQALSINFMESYQPECRTDFCSAKCKLNIADYTYPGTVLSPTSRSVFQATQLPAVPVTGSTTVGAHRYWRVRFTGVFNTDYVGMAEIKFYDQANSEITGGDPASYSNRDMTGDFLDLGIGGTTYHSDAARDNDIRSSWQCKKGDATVSWWSIDFGTGKDVKSITVVTPTTQTIQVWPLAFDLEYSDNNADWHLATPCSTQFTGDGQEETWTIGTTTSDPVDYPTSLDALPPPFTGASTYVGGLIKFTTGANRGKVLEIIDFDEATNTITLIDGFPYPIAQGDKFDISQGCDKTFTTCKVYNNADNFRGEPHVPGQDEFLSYPDAHD